MGHYASEMGYKTHLNGTEEKIMTLARSHVENCPQEMK